MRGDSAGRWLRTDRILLAAGLLVLIYFFGNILLLVFAAILLAVGLDALVSGLVARTPLSRGPALALVIVALLVLFIVIVATTAPQIVQQLGQLRDSLVAFAERAGDWLLGAGGEEMVSGLGGNGGAIAGALQDVLTYAAQFGMTALGALANIIIFLVIAVFAVADPALYRHGALNLIPPERRPLVDETFSLAAHSLRWWFLGQLASMAMLSVSVGLLLFVVGVELWLALAVITGLLTFIPFLGPVIAGVPVIIVAFTAGAQTGLIVAVLYLIIQNVEGNFITPLIQQKAVKVAPALLISMQLIFTTAFGIMGLILAAPLTVVAMVAVKKLYIEAVLGDREAAEL